MSSRIASVQMTSSHDVKENLANAKKWIEAAADQGASLVVLPEMFAMMGLAQDEKVRLRETVGQGLIQDFLSEMAIKQNLWLIGGTIPLATEHDPHRVRAACLVYNNEGQNVARYDKVHLFDVHLRESQEAYSESSTIEPGDRVVVVSTPFGRLGLAVCYDLRFPELFRRMQAQGVEVIAVPTAFTYTTGCAHWEVLVRARAIENLAYVITSCQTGTHTNGRRTYGHSMIVNPWGVVQAVLPEEEGIVISEIQLDYLHQLRQDFPVLQHQKL